MFKIPTSFAVNDIAVVLTTRSNLDMLVSSIFMHGCGTRKYRSLVLHAMYIED